MLCGECGHHSPHDGSACPRNGCKWVCYWLWQRTRVRFPFWDLNWLRIAYEVDAAFRQPISPKNLLDRPVPTGIPACFSMEFALVRSSPQRFDCVLSIVVWCGVPPHHHNAKSQPLRVWLKRNDCTGCNRFVDFTRCKGLVERGTAPLGSRFFLNPALSSCCTRHA